MYHLIGRDNARTPVQWSDAKFAGFMPPDTPGTVKPWMSIRSDYTKWNARNAVSDEDSAYNYWKAVLKTRKEYRDILVYGDFRMLDLEHECVIAYVRTTDREPRSNSSGAGTESGEKTQALVVTNFGGEDQPDGMDGQWWRIPDGFEDMLVDKGSPRTDTVIKALRNYKTENEVRKYDDGWWIKLRPYEAIVAMV